MAVGATDTESAPSDVQVTLGQPGAFTSFFGPDPLNLLGVVILTSLGTWGLPQMVHKFYTIRDERAVRTGTIVSTFFAVVISGGCYFLGGFGRLFSDAITYQADGVIVTTPTGSTAYSLSNGGPVIAPDTATLCLTPVAPHSLTVRPIVVPDNSVITMKVESRSHNFLAAVDGRSMSLNDGTVVRIFRAPYSARIVRFTERRYFTTLREKMMWGMDQR